MSLFPAYFEATSVAAEKQDWLNNASYKTANNLEHVKQQRSDSTLAESSDALIQTQDIQKKQKSHSKSKEHKGLSTKQEKELYDELLRENIAKFSKNKVFIEDVGLQPEQTFRIDTKPDHNNLVFGTLNATVVARYKKSCQVWKATDLVPSCNVNITDVNLERPGDVLFTSSSLAYIPIETKEDHPSSRIFHTTHSCIVPSFHEYSKEKNSDYSSRLRVNPQDIDLWLEYINFQDEYVFSEKSEEQKKRIKYNDRAIVEKKLSIVQKALEQNIGNIKLLRIKVKFLQLISDSQEVCDEWKKILGKFSMRVEVWKDYLNFLCGDFSVFYLPSVITAHHKCLEKLKQIQCSELLAEEKPPHLEEHMSDICLSLCLLLRQSGKMEHAIAICQALIEFNFFRPASLSNNPSLHEQLMFFEPFWDSGASRIGEEGFVGWENVMKVKSNIVRAPDVTLDLQEFEDIVLQNTDSSLSQKWCKIEYNRDENQWLPWRLDPSNLSADDECEDPSRLVLFDDVLPFLFTITNPDAQFHLCLNMFILCVPHAICQSHVANVVFGVNNLNMQDSISTLVELPIIITEFLSSCGPTIASHTFKAFIERIVMSCQLLLEEPMKTVLLLLWLRYQRCSMSDHKLLRKTVKKFLKVDRNNLLLYSEYAALQSDSRAKSILQTSLLTAAQNPMDKVNSMAKTSLAHIFRYLAELEIRTDNSLNALWILACLGNGEPLTIREDPIPGEFIVKASKKYYAVALELTSSSDCIHNLRNTCFQFPDFTVDWIVCYALYKLVSDGFESAMEVYKVMLQRIQPTDSLSENKQMSNFSLWQYHIREQIYIAYVNLCVTSADNKHLPFVISQALQEFPGSPHILKVFTHSKTSCSIMDPLWRDVVSLVKKTESVLLPLGLVSALLERDKQLESAERDSHTLLHKGGPVVHVKIIWNKVTAILESAIQNDALSGCPLLWRILLRVAYLRNDIKKCKSVFYLAIQKCPWNKMLYMDAVRYIPEEVQVTMDLMCEKQLHVRLPLEELQGLLQPVSLPPEMMDVSA